MGSGLLVYHEGLPSFVWETRDWREEVRHVHRSSYPDDEIVSQEKL